MSMVHLLLILTFRQDRDSFTRLRKSLYVSLVM